VTTVRAGVWECVAAAPGVPGAQQQGRVAEAWGRSGETRDMRWKVGSSRNCAQRGREQRNGGSMRNTLEQTTPLHPTRHHSTPHDTTTPLAYCDKLMQGAKERRGKKGRNMWGRRGAQGRTCWVDTWQGWRAPPQQRALPGAPLKPKSGPSPHPLKLQTPPQPLPIFFRSSTPALSAASLSCPRTP